MSEEESIFFPNDDELRILNDALRQYNVIRNAPIEKQRIFILDVTNNLLQIKKNWDERKVRLWLSSQSQMQQTRSTEEEQFIKFQRPQSAIMRPLSIPPKKRIAASISSSSLSAQESMVSSPVNNSSIATIFSNEIKAPLTQEEQKGSEIRQTKSIEIFNNRKWVDNVAPFMGWNVINAVQTLPTSISPYANVQLNRTSAYGYRHPSSIISGGLQPKLVKFFNGPSSFTNKEFGMIEACVANAAGSPAVIDFTDNKHVLHYNDHAVPIGSLYPPSSMIYDNASSSLFIAQQSSITQIAIADGSTMRVIPTGGPPMRQSCLCMHQGILVCASLSNFYTFSIEGEVTTKAQAPLPNVTSMASVSNNLIIASNNSPVIYSVDKDCAIVGRFLSHEGGITCLYSIDDTKFISGSADSTIKLWDVRTQFPLMQFQRHIGSVTALGSDDLVIVSGGEDRKLRTWDARNGLSMFECNVGCGIPQSIYVSVDKGKISCVTTQQKCSTADGLGMTKVVPSSQGIGLVAPNQFLQFLINPINESVLF